MSHTSHDQHPTDDRGDPGISTRKMVLFTVSGGFALCVVLLTYFSPMGNTATAILAGLAAFPIAFGFFDRIVH